jgi:hypothetical protein
MLEVPPDFSCNESVITRIRCFSKEKKMKKKTMTEALARVTDRTMRILTGKKIAFAMGRGKRMPFAIALIAALCSSFSWSLCTEPSGQSTQSASIADSRASVAVVTQDAEEPKAPLLVRIETEKGPYVIVNGDSLTINGPGSAVMSGADNPQSQTGPKRDTAKPTGDRIRFIQDGKAYTISDPATVEYAKSLFRGMEELGRKQRELGSQQGQLRADRGGLRQQQQENGSDPDEETAAAPLQLAKILAQAAKQLAVSEEQVAMAKQQTQLARKQVQLAREQMEAARHAMEEVKQIIMDSLRNGSAIPD